MEQEPLDSRKWSWTLHSPVHTTSAETEVIWGSLALSSCTFPGPGILWLFYGENERDFVLGYPWSIINRHRRGSESVFPLKALNSDLCGTRRVSGHRWEVERSGSRNGSVCEHCSDDLDYFRPNLCSVSYCTLLGWMIFLANVSASNYFQIRCGQLQI